MASNLLTTETLIALRELPLDSMFTASETAIFLMISVSTLARMRKDAIGPAYVKGTGPIGAIQYRKQDLADWLAAVNAGGKVR